MAETRHLQSESPVPALLRHFSDLRDGTHGPGAQTRTEKEQLFASATDLLAEVALRVLTEVDEGLLVGTGTRDDSGVTRTDDGGSARVWSLTWMEQQRAQIPPIQLIAYYGAGFHHPHLRGGTVGEWPLNVFSEFDARAELGTLRAIAAAEIHNLVFQADYRIVPAMVAARRTQS